MLLLKSGGVSVLYDEAARYRNRNYDVSFYPSSARFGPGDALLAYTIVSTARVGGEIRLSSDGKDDAGELTRVRSAVGELPAVEILRPGSPARSVAVIPHAELVGWLTEGELLVARDRRLTVCDTHGKTRRATSIRVRTAADTFLR